MLSIEKAMFLEVCSGLSSGLKYRYPDIDVEGIPRPDTVVLDGDHLVELAALCRSDHPEGATLIEALSAQAEPLLTAIQDSVVQKTHVEARRSPNDYSSLAKYWWPDEKSDDGLPYVRRDGEVNPDCYSERYDASRLVSMVESLQVLSLAAWLTGDQRYAECAVRRIEAWFLDEATRQTPHFEYAQHIPGRHQTRAAAVIEARHLIYVTEAALLLESMNALTAEQSDGLRQWFRSLLDWLQNSETGQEAARAGNNIGFWYDLQRMAYASFTGDSTLVEYIALNSVRVRALDQIEPDGTLAMEMQRAHPQDYVSFTLVAMAQLSRYGDQAGVPLWDQQEADGRGFQVAHDWLGHQVESRQARQQAKALKALTMTAGGRSQDLATTASTVSDLILRLGLVNRLAERRQQMLTQKARHNRVHLEHIQTLENKLRDAEKTIESLRKDATAQHAGQMPSLAQEDELSEVLSELQAQLGRRQQENAWLADRMATLEQQTRQMPSDHDVETAGQPLSIAEPEKTCDDKCSEPAREPETARQTEPDSDDTAREEASVPLTAPIPFVFGISLRAKSTTHDWPLMCQNLERTLQNLARQSDTNFQVYIVVHDIPEIDTQGLDVHFITVDFPVSFNEEGRPVNDKNRKKRVLGAFLQAQQMPAFYFMALDADDLLHPDLVKTARDGNSQAGYLIERGFMYDCGSRNIGRCDERTKRFWEHCGSCAIFYFEPDDLPTSNGDKQAYFSRLAEHSKYSAVAREHGRELMPLEEYMGVYLVNHGENDWSVYRGREGSKEQYIKRNRIDDAEAIAFHETWPELT
ncbi:alginate lyase family protein [Kushneria sp. EE4]